MGRGYGVTNGRGDVGVGYRGVAVGVANVCSEGVT